MTPPRRGRRRATGGLVVVIGMLLASCASQSPIRLPAPPPVIQLQMREYAFEQPAVFPRGRVVIEAHNVGTVAHRFVVAPLEPEFPPVAEQIRGSERRYINPLAGIPDQQPGQYGSVAVDLPPGRYGLFCLVVDPDGQSHSSKGMGSEFTVR